VLAWGLKENTIQQSLTNCGLEVSVFFQLYSVLSNMVPVSFDTDHLICVCTEITSTLNKYLSGSPENFLVFSGGRVIQPSEPFS
jgi:hypothetical protein